MKTQEWFTQPPQSFSSYYYYNPGNKRFIRIRLELGRKEKGGNPAIFFNMSRYVGFATEIQKKQMDFKDMSRWTVNDKNQIVYTSSDGKSKIELPTNSTKSLKTIDFTLPEGKINPAKHVHHGNAVINEGDTNLPENTDGEKVSVEMLSVIAEYYINQNLDNAECINLGTSKSTEAELADEIFEIYAKIKGK